jgi:AAA15 family ATPase/GTPase
MLTHLQLDNCKIWHRTGLAWLVPIKLLVGANFSGKCSLIKSLLLLRKTVKGKDYPSETLRVLKKEESNEFGEYRTQRLVLAAWDALHSREVA